MLWLLFAYSSWVYGILLYYAREKKQHTFNGWLECNCSRVIYISRMQREQKGLKYLLALEELASWLAG